MTGSQSRRLVGHSNCSTWLPICHLLSPQPCLAVSLPLCIRARANRDASCPETLSRVTTCLRSPVFKLGELSSRPTCSVWRELCSCHKSRSAFPPIWESPPTKHFVNTMIDYTKHEGAAITEDMIDDIAVSFSENYGVWGPAVKPEKQGRRVRASPARLRADCLPSSPARNFLVQAKDKHRLIGHVIATRWTFENLSICWITQLCVNMRYRRQGLATKVKHSMPPEVM